MIRRRSYLNHLNHIYCNADLYIDTTSYIRFRNAVFLPRIFYIYIKLHRKRLIHRRHLNQFIFINNIFYYWVRDYQYLSFYFKMVFLSYWTNLRYTVFNVPILYNWINKYFHVYTILHWRYDKTKNKFYHLIPKYNYSFVEFNDYLTPILKATPLFYNIQMQYYNFFFFNKYYIYLITKLYITFFSFYLVMLKEYYSSFTLLLLLKC